MRCAIHALLRVCERRTSARMNFGSEPKRRASEGDLVLLQERRDVLVPIVLRRGAQLENRHGKFQHDDMIGAEFGSQVRVAVC